MGKKDKDKRNNSATDAKPQRRAARQAQQELKRAEKRLAKALHNLEDARATLLTRETELAALLTRHGRMPMAGTTPNGLGQSVMSEQASAEETGTEHGREPAATDVVPVRAASDEQG